MYTLLKNNNKRFFKLLLNHNKIKKIDNKQFLYDKYLYFNELKENPYYNFNYHYKLRLIHKPFYNPKKFKGLKIKKMFYLRKSIH